jgi:hypothetical protein
MAPSRPLADQVRERAAAFQEAVNAGLKAALADMSEMILTNSIYFR